MQSYECEAEMIRMIGRLLELVWFGDSANNKPFSLDGPGIQWPVPSCKPLTAESVKEVMADLLAKEPK